MMIKSIKSKNQHNTLRFNMLAKTHKNITFHIHAIQFNI